MVEEAEPHTDRRTREHARRVARARRKRAVGTVLTIGIVVLATLVATDTIRLHGSGPSLASGKTTATRVTAPSNATPVVAKLKRQRPPRPLSHAAPLRLWIGGDSISGELGFQLGPEFSKLGIVQAHVDYKVSSGLASNAIRDWPARFAQEDAQYHPEAIVFMVGANDASIVGSAVDSSGTPLWESQYRAQVDRMMDLLVGGAQQRTVFWIGSPTLGTHYNHGASEVDRVMREEAAKRPTVVYVDAFKMFASNGEYAASFPDKNGIMTRLRTDDGVHLTTAGAQYLANHVFALINARWSLLGQAEPSEPIEYTIEPSSSSFGGVHIGSGYHPTYTAPTTTAPPAPPSSTAPTTGAPASTTTAPKSTTTVPKSTSTTTPSSTPSS